MFPAVLQTATLGTIVPPVNLPMEIIFVK